MRRPVPLPAHLPESFRIDDAHRAGVGRGRLLKRDLLVPTRGVRLRVTERAPELEMLARLRALSLVLPPDAAFSHLTAARIHGCPTPRTWSPAEPVHVTTQTRSPIRRRGIVTHFHPGVELKQRGGLPVVAAQDAWVQCATFLSVDDLVVMGDFLCADHPQRGAALQTTVRRHAGRRGVVALRQAVELIRCGSASPRETQFRLLFHRAGLPEPALNRDLVDAHGNWLGRPDFCWDDPTQGWRLIVEYDGEHHRLDRRQWQRDKQRERAFRAAGWEVIVLTDADYRHPGPVLDLIATALGF